MAVAHVAGRVPDVAQVLHVARSAAGTGLARERFAGRRVESVLQPLDLTRSRGQVDVLSMDQPMILREYTSSTIARYSHPDQVGT
jgi:hypothetical protein